ncbi:MAG: CPBP family glutamic-type intramembrane protease [Terriglobia bacterium]
MKALLGSPLKLRPNGLIIYVGSVVVLLAVVTALILEFSSGRLPVDRRFFAATFCLNGFLAVLLLLAHRDVQTRITARVFGNRGNAWLFLFPVLLLYLAYALGTDSLGALPALKLAAYVLLPAALLLTIRQPEQRLLWQDVLVILALWLPLDFRWMRDVWGWPSHSLAYSMNSLLATGLAVFLFVCVRRLEGVGYRCHFEKRAGWISLRNFLLFAPIAIPIGIVTGFISISGRQLSIWEILLSALGIFFLIAIPEELLFRGIIQNFLEKTFRKPAFALIVASLIFGAAHLNNGPRPDWRYFLLASLAGLFYGNAYQRTRGLLMPAIVHTLVDTVWRAFFR